MIRFETQLVSWELTDEYGWPLSGDSAKSIISKTATNFPKGRKKSLHSKHDRG